MSVNNHLEIIATFYIVFAIISTISVIIKIARSRKITIMNMCSIMYILLLCVIPALILFGYTSGLSLTSSIVFEEKTVWTFYSQLILTIIGYLILHFGYKIKQKESKTYTITIDFAHLPSKTISGSFDRRGLPTEWASFANDLREFLLFYE